MRFLSKSPNGKMIKLGDDPKTSVWYCLADNISLENIQVNDEVSFQFEKRGGSNVLTFLAKGNVETPPKSKEEIKIESKKEVETKPKENIKVEKVEIKESTEVVAKKVENYCDNKKLSIGKMTAETLIALQDKLTLENILDLIDKIYDKYSKKVG